MANDTPDADDLLLLTVEPDQMESTLKALEEAGLTRSSGLTTATGCSWGGGGVTCKDADSDQV